MHSAQLEGEAQTVGRFIHIREVPSKLLFRYNLGARRSENRLLSIVKHFVLSAWLQLYGAVSSRSNIMIT